jgi:hypothetical protein
VVEGGGHPPPTCANTFVSLLVFACGHSGVMTAPDFDRLGVSETNVTVFSPDGANVTVGVGPTFESTHPRPCLGSLCPQLVSFFVWCCLVSLPRCLSRSQIAT